MQNNSVPKVRTGRWEGCFPGFDIGQVSFPALQPRPCSTVQSSSLAVGQLTPKYISYQLVKNLQNAVKQRLLGATVLIKQVRLQQPAEPQEDSRDEALQQWKMITQICVASSRHFIHSNDESRMLKLSAATAGSCLHHETGHSVPCKLYSMNYVIS